MAAQNDVTNTEVSVAKDLGKYCIKARPLLVQQCNIKYDKTKKIFQITAESDICRLIKADISRPLTFDLVIGYISIGLNNG